MRLSRTRKDKPATRMVNQISKLAPHWRLAPPGTVPYIPCFISRRCLYTVARPMPSTFAT
jgi:hypothetical protein